MSNVSIIKMEILAEKIDLELNGRDPTSYDLEPSLKEMLSRYAFCITLVNNTKKRSEPYPNKYDPDQVAREAEIINAPIRFSAHGLFSKEYRKLGDPPSCQTCSP